MNHHFRSYSETTPNVINGDNGRISQLQPQQMNAPPTTSTTISSSNSVIHIHPDSQQSLDRLFDLSTNEAPVPLRQRNLPSSFFNPTANQDTVNRREEPKGPVGNLHQRSTSFDVRPKQSNLHARTQSVLAPMSGLSISGSSTRTSTNCSAYSSLQRLNVPGNESNHGSAHSSITNLNSNHHHQPVQQLHQHLPQSALGSQQQMPVQSYHYRNYSSPAYMQSNQPAPIFQQHQEPTQQPVVQTSHRHQNNYSRPHLSSSTELVANQPTHQHPTEIVHQRTNHHHHHQNHQHYNQQHEPQYHQCPSQQHPSHCTNHMTGYTQQPTCTNELSQPKMELEQQPKFHISHSMSYAAYGADQHQQIVDNNNSLNCINANSPNQAPNNFHQINQVQRNSGTNLTSQPSYSVHRGMSSLALNDGGIDSTSSFGNQSYILGGQQQHQAPIQHQSQQTIRQHPTQPMDPTSFSSGPIGHHHHSHHHHQPPASSGLVSANISYSTSIHNGV